MKTDSQGNELKDGDILLSSKRICPVKYKLEGDRVECLDIQGNYDFEFFKTLRPHFVKQK